MEIDKLPFKIGVHYENWEFDLEIAEDNIELEKYKYVGSGITHLYGLKVSRIYLCFSLDILSKIEIFFCYIKNRQTYGELKEELIKNNIEINLVWERTNSVGIQALYKDYLRQIEYRVLAEKSKLSLTIYSP